MVNLISSPQPITLRNLHKMKLAAQCQTKSEQERLVLMRIMYADSETYQQNFEQEKQRLELEQLRAETTATRSETINKSTITLHKNAKAGVKSEKTNKQKITSLAKQGGCQTKLRCLNKTMIYLNKAANWSGK